MHHNSKKWAVIPESKQAGRLGGDHTWTGIWLLGKAYPPKQNRKTACCWGSPCCCPWLPPWVQWLVPPSQGFPAFGRDLPGHFEIFAGEFQQVASTAAFLFLLAFRHVWQPKHSFISRTCKAFYVPASHTLRDSTGPWALSRWKRSLQDKTKTKTSRNNGCFVGVIFLPYPLCPTAFTGLPGLATVS